MIPVRDMSFNLLDIAVAAYVVYGAMKGRKRGIAEELPQLIALLIFVLTGCGLFKWAKKLISGVHQLTGQALGVLSFVAIAVGAFLIARKFRAAIKNWVEQKTPAEESRKQSGMIVGGFRALVIGAAIVVFIGLLPLGALGRPFSSGSFLGRNLIRFVVPVYDELAGNGGQ